MTKQFESFAECCLELARSADTTERRARFIQMADAYRLATLLISEERKSRRLLPSAAESHLLSLAAEAPAAASPGLQMAGAQVLAPVNKTPLVKARQRVGTQKDRHVNKTEIDRLLHRWRAWLFRTLANALFAYRPELHYMRGPGPKWRARHRRVR